MGSRHRVLAGVLSFAALLAAPALATPRPGFGVRDAVVEPAERESFLRANAAFSLDLYARLRVREGNLVCSPLGVSVVLGMLAEGARGGTREELTPT